MKGKQHNINSIVTHSFVIAVLLIIAALFEVGCGKTSYLEDESNIIEADKDESDTSLGEDNSESSEDNEEESTDIYVDVQGAVASPGVYCLKSGSRFFEAIDMAGGYCSDAYTDNLNQASILEDGTKIYVYTHEQVAELGLDNLGSESVVLNNTEVASDNKININTATAEELTTLNGIGPSRAQTIVEYRQTNGNFSAIEELTNVSGIGEATLNKIKDKIKV